MSVVCPYLDVEVFCLSSDGNSMKLSIGQVSCDSPEDFCIPVTLQFVLDIQMSYRENITNIIHILIIHDWDQLYNNALCETRGTIKILKICLLQEQGMRFIKA